MKRALNWVQGFALAWGGFGLFGLGFLDSSFLSFPEVIDLLVIFMVTRHKERLLWYVLTATAGSTAGCVALYLVARKGGETFVRKWFKAHHFEGALRLFQRHGLLAVMVPALLPPPAPFKIFVLLAGVAAVPLWQFAGAVAVARFIRYFAEGLLAFFYGERASAFVRAHAAQASLWLAGGTLVLGLLSIWWSRHHLHRD
ncbi:MAG TPA: VTT domain-containing protein [Vicinamibacterales bacterium]|nr:VTT domain-containing protein [Vicinamibacterales bacterium]